MGLFLEDTEMPLMPLSTQYGVTLLIFFSYRNNCLFCMCVSFPWENSFRTKVKSKVNAG